MCLIQCFQEQHRTNGFKIQDRFPAISIIIIFIHLKCVWKKKSTGLRESEILENIQEIVILL